MNKPTTAPVTVYEGESLKQLLPHRPPMLLLDNVEKYIEDDTIIAVGHYHVRGDEFFLQGHFPGNPVVPGVIQLEILAQTACPLLTSEGSTELGEKKTTPLYTGLDKVRFRSPLRPGDCLTTRCRIVRAKPPFYFAEGEGYVEDRLCVKAEFSFAITVAKEAPGN